MLLFLNIYHQKYFDLLDFIPRFVQTINLQIYYKHYEKDTVEDGYPYQRDRDDFGS